ncbi:IS66-like element accessory protein TnpA [Bradyrhizobium sp. UFLA05-112]|jgi:transposase
MDRHTHSAQIERLGVVETGRRRRWSEDEKLKIVVESLQGVRQVSATARRHGISRSQLLQWRRLFRARQEGGAEQPTGFIPALVVPEAEPTAPMPTELAAAGAIEIEFVTGVRMRITGTIDAVTLTTAVAALSSGRR